MNRRLLLTSIAALAEQETVADVLNALKTNASPTGSIPSPTDAEAMQNLNEAGKATVEKFRGLKAGSAFDKVFIQTEIDAHRLLLGFQETYLKSPDDLDATNVAKLAQAVIKEHLTLLGDMQKTG